MERSKPDSDPSLLGRGGNAGQAKLARLCLTPSHGTDLHWHYLEDVKGPSPRQSVSHPPGTLDEATMLNDVFIPTMRITNVTIPLL